MRVLVDTNILISAILFPGSRVAKTLIYITDNYEMFLCDQNIVELREVLQRKKPEKLADAEVLLTELSYELIPAAYYVEKLIRDVKDQPILNAAIIADVDVILTGDKDFLSLDIKHPKCMSVAEFLEYIEVEMKYLCRGIYMFKLAIIQVKATPNNIEANLSSALRLIEQASHMGADMVLFPEMWSNGYAPPYEEAFDEPFHPAYEKEREIWLQQAVDKNSSYVKSLQKAARDFHIGVTATYLAKTAAKPQNTAIVIDRSGEIILEYAKVHTCDFSLEALLQNGEEFKVCEFEGIKLGVMICYDREFPESARVLMLKGAEIILVPNACDMNPARINQLSTRAFENMAGVAMANYPGEGWGRSCAFSPMVFGEQGYMDTTIFMADDLSEQIYMAEFDMDEIRAYRACETWGNAYRKPKTYGDLLSDKVEEPFIRENIRK